MKDKKNRAHTSHRKINVISATIVMSLSLMLTGCGSNEGAAGMSLSDNKLIDQVGNVDEPNMPIDGGADIAVTTTTSPTATPKPKPTTKPEVPATTKVTKPPTQPSPTEATLEPTVLPTEIPSETTLEPTTLPTEVPIEPTATPTEVPTDIPTPTVPAITVDDLRAAAEVQLNGFTANVEAMGGYVDATVIRSTDNQYGIFALAKNAKDPEYYSDWMIKAEVSGANITAGWYIMKTMSSNIPAYEDYDIFVTDSYNDIS